MACTEFLRDHPWSRSPKQIQDKITMTPKDDISSVEQPASDDEEDKNELVNAEIIAVSYIATSKCCGSSRVNAHRYSFFYKHSIFVEYSSF